MFNKSVVYWLAGVFLFFLQNSVWGAVFCVDPSGGGTHTDLQAALDAAEATAEEDTIKVVQGIYTGNFTYASSSGHSLVLEGGYDSGCVFRRINPVNTVLQGAGDGSVLVITDSSGGSLTIDGFTVKNGGGIHYGGGIYARSKASVRPAGDITIRNNIFVNNQAINTGGGIYAESSTGTNPFPAGNITLINNIVTGNRADGLYGGGVYVQVYSSDNSVGTIIVTNNTIHGNRAGQYGGGIETYSYGKVNAGPVRVYNNIVTGNASGYDGADISINNYSTGGSSYGYNNNYHGLSGTWTNEGGNIDADPVFVSPGHWDDGGTPGEPADDVWVGGDCHLQSGSPCIDAGDNAAPELPGLDFESSARVADGNRNGAAVVDMGADEYTLPGTALPWLPLLLFP